MEIDYVQKLRELAITKSTGWQQADCPVVRTSTIETGKAWKAVLSEARETKAELYKKCELAIHAQAKYRREARNTKQHNPQPKMLSAWLRAGRWEEEIGSHAELKEKVSMQICATKGCSNSVHGPQYDKCSNHTRDSRIDFDAEKRAYLRVEGLTMTAGETVSSYAKKCRDHLVKVNLKIARRLGIEKNKS